MTMLLTVPNYDDWRWAGTGVNPPGAPVAAVLTEITTDEWAWVFANNATMVFPDQQIPHDYAEGTNIQPHIHWTPTTTATYTGTWTMVITDWVSATTGTAKSGPTTLTAAFTGAVTAGQMQTQDFNTVLTGLNRKISSMATITLKLALSAGVGCALRGLDAHYQVNTLGSRLITTK